MKIIKEELKDNQYKNETEKAKKEAEKIIDPKERKKEKPFIGASKLKESFNSSIKELIRAKLEDAVDSIFFDVQEKEGISSVGILPEDSVQLDDIIDYLASIMEKVISYEKEGF